MVKRRDSPIMSSRNKRDECKLTSDEASKGSTTTPKPEFPPCSGSSMADTYVLAMRCPVFRRHDSYSGFRTELENLFGDAKGKGTSGGPARLNVLMRRPGSDCSIVVTKRSNARGAKGAGHPRWDRVNWKQEELHVLAEGGSFHWVARAV